MASDDSPADFFRRLPRTPPAATPHDAGGPKRYGIPPSYPHFPPSPAPAPAPPPAAAMAATGGSHHARSLSQPAFFSFDALPPLSPTPYREPASSSLSDPITGADVAMDDSAGSAPSFADRWAAGPAGVGGGGPPPRKTHRRSASDVSFSFSGDAQALLFGGGGGGGPAFVKREGVWTGDGDRRSESEIAGDDLFSAFMNLDFVNSTDSGFLEKSPAAENRDDLDSRASGSGTKANREESSENEVESSMEVSDCSLEKKGAQKRSYGAVGAPRHSRSVSVDSFMGGLPNFADESLRLPPSPGVISGQHSRSNSLDGSSNPFGFEQGSGDFSGAEMNKIMANEKLAEIAASDPKRAKRLCSIFWLNGF